MQDEISLLLIDDDQVDRLSLARALRKTTLNYKIFEAENSQQAREHLAISDVDCILLDYHLGAENGLDVLRSFIKDKISEASIIMLSGIDDDDTTLKFLEDGAEDYLHKDDLSPRILTRSIRYAQERRRNKEYLRKLADVDSLTGLHNRRAFLNDIEGSISRAQRANKSIALIFVDLDGFKGINDTLGHNAGDQLLQVVAERLKSAVRSGDVVARLGGDEFVILLERVIDDEKLSGFADHLRELMAESLFIKKKELHLTASFGIATFPRDGSNSAELLQYADAAMYRAKQEGRNGYCFYSHELHELAKNRELMKHDLHRAIANQEFELYYQPIIGAKNGICEKAEALIRWHHPEKGTVPPMQFIPVAEELGLILVIGHWVITESCRQLAEWKKNNLFHKSFVISVNLSGRQLEQSELPDFIFDTVKMFGLNCSDIEFEITETHLMSDLSQTSTILEKIIAMGCSIAIDDFGTGYSSFRHLQKLPRQTLKIDRSFVSEMNQGEDSLALVNAMIEMAKILKLQVVAEGVETEEERDKLCMMNCDQLQGYLFSRPLPNAEFLEYMERQAARPSYMPTPIEAESPSPGLGLN